MCIQEIIISKSLYIKHIICFIFARSYVHPENIKNIKKIIYCKYVLQPNKLYSMFYFQVISETLGILREAAVQ